MPLNTHNTDLLHTTRSSLPLEGISLAVLTASKPANVGLAVCRFNADVTADGTSPRVQLAPDGYFSAGDGRPSDTEHNAWLMDETAFNTLKADASTRQNDYHFDYEHQTLHAEENGKEAPAAGWFNPTDLEYIPGEGLFALNVQWTKKAAQFLRDDEYRFISPVFHYGPDGRPVKLRHFALTNEPAVDGMRKVAVLKTSTPEKETTMNEALQLLALLGVTVGDGEQPTTDQYATGLAALKALKTKADSADELSTKLTTANTTVATLKASSGSSVDLSKYVPVATYNAVTQQLAVLKTENDGLTVEQSIDAAKADGRIIEAEVSYFQDLGKQNGVAVLKAALDARSPIAALTGTTQSTAAQKKKADEEQNRDPELTTEELAVLKATGIDKAAFLKNKDA
ncbi:phage scaffold protein [Pseudoalteromonas fuliginea]|uniref:Phage scaffold protein n=1 Tax=Pseudoalteromonas fuliginea TaxID=1872678 RepID=A0AB73BM58_9GAMM|nr:phage scaffold protein [Pseudoalteromonas fuliginea]